MNIDEKLQEAISAHQNGKFAEAQDAYIEVLTADPDNADGLHFLGVLHFEAGAAENAVKLIEKSLTQAPRNAAAHNNLANILKISGDDNGALISYVRAIELEPRHKEAWKNISLLLHGAKHNDELLPVLGEIVRLDPDNPNAWHNYGLSLMFAGRREEAADALETCLQFGADIWNDPVWHARVLCALGRREKAIEHLEKVVEAVPENEIARYQLSAVRGDDLQRAPESYVKSHFDTFSDSFDEVLERLDYKAPELVAQQVALLAATRSDPFEDVVDLGCGTGLCGPLIREHCGTLSGIDLSTGMLNKAATLKVYDFLVEGELVAFLNSKLPTQFDLAVCVDTLCYLGDLQPFMHALEKALKPGASMIASVEHLDDQKGPDFRVDSTGRYAHSPDYLRRSSEAAGMTFVKADTAVLRHELGENVQGLIFQVQKP